MAGQAQGKVHYRLEGSIGDPTVTGKAYILDMNLRRGEIIDSVNINKGVIEPKEGDLPDATICSLVFGDMPQNMNPLSGNNLYPIILGVGTTKVNGRIGTHANLSGNKLCDDLSAFYQAEMKVIGDWQKSCLENNPNPGPASLSDMGPEYTERREKMAIDIVNRHTSDILGYYLLHEVAINYMPPARWLELFDKMEPWLKTKPALYSYLSKFKAVREAALKK